MNTSTIQTINGKLVSVSSIKQTRKVGRWTIGLLVNDVWYNAFGTEETLNKLISGLERGNDVTVKFKTNGMFKELVSVNPIVQQELKTPVATIPEDVQILIPVSQTWHMVEDGVLSIKRFKMALKVIESDCAFLQKELDKIDSP
jgi:hypothetical protein